MEEILSALELKHEQPGGSNEMLERLRVQITRFDGQEDRLLIKRVVSICCRYGFDETSSTTNRIALRCLCNVLLLVEPARQLFIGENHISGLTEKMKNGDREDEFLSARLLFLCTYETHFNFDMLFEDCNIAEVINTNLSRHANHTTSTAENYLSSKAGNACSENLKLLYNLIANRPQRASLFASSLAPILQMLNNIDIPSPPLQPPVSWLVNCLIHLEDKDAWFSTLDNNVNVDRLVHILDLATLAYTDEEMERYGSPLLHVLIRISEIAPPDSKSHLRALLLPSNQDRDRVIGTGNSLPERLLKLYTTPTSFKLKELIPALLFELSERDVKRFVRNVGYGFASGFLFSRGIELPPNSIEETGGEDLDVNPITGQRRDMEPDVQMPEMTDEEKEREAERLFVLFERLQRTGVVDVENPVAKAVREGRFEELD